MAEAGVAYVDIRGRFNTLNAGIDKALAGITAKFGSTGVKAVAALGGAVAGAGALTYGLYKVGEAFDSAYDKIRVGTGATGKVLEGLKDDFRAVVKSVPTDFDSAATAVGYLKQRLDLTGPTLQARARQFLELSRLTGTDLSSNMETVTRLFGDWSITTEGQGKALDKLFRASQASGVSIDVLGQLMVRYGAPFRQLGFSFDQAAALVAKFQKEGVNTELVLGSMRIALGKMARAGEEPVETFRRIVEQIKNTGSASEANALALQLFGARAGPDMAAAIREGRFEVDDLVASIAGGHDTITKAGKDTEDFGEKWQKIKNRVLVALEPVATKVFDAIGRAMDVLGPIVTKVLGWFTNLGSSTSGIWGSIRDTIGSVVASIRTIWDQFGPQIMAVISATWGEIKAVIQGALNVIKGVFDIFAGIFSGDWSRVWDGIKSIFSGVWGAIVGIAASIWEKIKLAAFIAWTAFKNIVVGAWNGVIDFIKGVPGTLVNIFVGVGKAIGNAVIGGINAAIQLVNDILPNKIGLPWPLPDIDLPDNPIPKIPKLHTGGQYRAPTVGGEGLALLKDREVVFTPQQAAALNSNTSGGVALTIENRGVAIIGNERDAQAWVGSAVKRLQAQGVL